MPGRRYKANPTIKGIYGPDPEPVRGDSRPLPVPPAERIPDGAVLLEGPKFLFLDNDCRKCVACNKRIPHTPKVIARVQDCLPWSPYRDDTGEHWHYPGESLLQYKCGYCGNRWNVRSSYECWCGWAPDRSG